MSNNIFQFEITIESAINGNSIIIDWLLVSDNPIVNANIIRNFVFLFWRYFIVKYIKAEIKKLLRAKTSMTSAYNQKE